MYYHLYHHDYHHHYYLSSHCRLVSSNFLVTIYFLSTDISGAGDWKEFVADEFEDSEDDNDDNDDSSNISGLII